MADPRAFFRYQSGRRVDYFRIVRHPGATRLAALKLFTEALNGVSPVRVPKTVID